MVYFPAFFLSLSVFGILRFAIFTKYDVFPIVRVSAFIVYNKNGKGTS